MYEYSAQVVRWVDGDTVDLRVDLGFHTFIETRFRLYGIDTPERGQKNHDEATALCNSLAPVGSKVVLKSHKLSAIEEDKYGRWLAEVGIDVVRNRETGQVAVMELPGGVSVNKSLVEAGLAVSYFGGKKGVAV
jgi:micrococcal nuclease